MAPTTDDARAASEPAATGASDAGASGTAGAGGAFGPYRGRFGAARPAALAALALPPARMPGWRGARPLKQWRYVGVYGAELMVCVGAVRVGLGRQSFWAVWDRSAERLHERTRLSRGGVRLAMAEPGRVTVRDGDVQIDLTLDEVDGVETLCPHGGAYAWTRKQGGVRAHGRVVLDGVEHALDAAAVVDDSAGYHARHTAWRWSAGVGTTADGRAAAWNLVEGINDPVHGSERTVWLDGIPVEAAPATFADDLGRVTTDDGGDLRFSAEALRERNENLLLVRSSYRQPFGTFAGTLPGGVELAEGRGVMEAHTAAW
ncbi:DUF2804 family protein [Conexibacter woesei]|uniref:DUF2804 domain-containing protein n=1 Tax=Conexibacter woesei (strain DSM 14684 / CCUG 47730 / CIP 108061 / JCM 11494 / NBRC 100937 / ID131577) TaxID=469383 RepID=D3F051_CONWI|nr:DUF2804 family protein [Conexibacter woesei]ADB50027.1 hypothetical protein Cwoe_1599 [Conexibacter woesei DSM 14684]